MHGNNVAGTHSDATQQEATMAVEFYYIKKKKVKIRRRHTYNIYIFFKAFVLKTKE